MRIFVTYFFLLISPVFTAGQDTDPVQVQDTLLSRTLNEVVVTASRFTSLRINTPEAIRTVGENSINEDQLRTAPEALLLTPGVFVQKTTHGGGSPFVRGLTGNQTLLLIDGIRLSNSTMRYGPNQSLNTIDVFSIEKMEVLRGSGSVQYGSDALGGAIQAFTHEPEIAEKAKWGSDMLARIATHNMEQSVRGGISHSGKNISFRTGVTWRNFGDIRGGDTTGFQSPTGYRELDYDLKGKMVFSPKTSLTMVYQDVNQRDIPVYHKIELEDYAINETDPQRRKLAYLRLNREINSGIFKSATMVASWQNTGEGREIRKNGSDILRTEYDRVRSLGFSAEAVMKDMKVWSGTMGIEAYIDRVNSRRTDTDIAAGSATEKRGLYPDGSGMSSLAAFTINKIDLDKWILSGGIRYNTFIIKVDDETLGQTRLTPSALVGNLAVLRKLNTASNLFVSFNTGFRAPNIDDLGTLGIVDFRYEMPDFNLKPESSFQYQAGYKYQTRKLRGEFYIYRNELYNLIVRNRIEDQYIEEYPVYRKENSDRAYIIGAETSWDYNPQPTWNFHGDITWTYGQNTTKNEPLRRIPPLFGRLAGEYRHKSWLMNIEWSAAGKQDRLAQGDNDDNRIPEGGTPGWNIFNINGSYTWRFVNIDLSLKNILNTDYRYHGSGVNGYGRSLFLTVAASI